MSCCGWRCMGWGTGSSMPSAPSSSCASCGHGASPYASSHGASDCCSQIGACAMGGHPASRPPSEKIGELRTAVAMPSAAAAVEMLSKNKSSCASPWSCVCIFFFFRDAADALAPARLAFKALLGGGISSSQRESLWVTRHDAPFFVNDRHAPQQIQGDDA